MVLSERKYIYGVDYNGIKEFLVSVLSDQDAVRYIREHRKVFDHRFDHYVFGKMSEDPCDWRFYESD